MKNGFATLVAVIITGAVGLAAVLALSSFSMSYSRITGDLLASEKARLLADGCAMEGLILARNSDAYVGSGSITIDGLTCQYQVINLGGASREIRGSSTVKNDTRKVKVLATASYPQMVVSSWQELGDF